MVPVSTHIASNQPAEPIAEPYPSYNKYPEPIIEPTTSMVPSSNPNSL
jgi:hypothetical protein